MSKYPADWKQNNLGNITDIVIGGTPSRNNPLFWDRELKTSNHWVSIRDLQKTKIDSTKEKISTLGASKSNVKLLPVGTILMSFKLTIGKLAIAKVPLFTNEAICGFLHDEKEVTNEYLYYGLQQWDLLKDIDQAIKGATLNKEKLKAIKIYYPSLSEQKKICEILSSVDKVIELTENELSKTQDLQKGMMQDLLTNGIGVSEFKESALGRIPASWKVMNLEQCTDQILDCKNRTPDFVESDRTYFVVRTSNVRNGKIQFKDAKYTNKDEYIIWTRRGTPQEGDILFTREAPVGESAVIPQSLKLCLGQRMMLFRCNQSVCMPNYLNQYIGSDVFKDYLRKVMIGTTVGRVNVEDVPKLNILIPSLKEQEKISKIILSIDVEITNKEKKLDKLLKLKKGLMQDLLTGKVRGKV